MAVVKPKFRVFICWVVLLLHISLIFSFSLQDAEGSTVVSEGLTGKIKTVEEFKADIAEETNDEATAERLAKNNFLRFEAVIRKVAHFSLFLLLGVYLNLLLGFYGIGGGFRVATSILFAGAIAFFDETIQLFSAGRAGRLTDVLIDTSGAAVAAILFFIGGKIYEKNKKRRINMDS